MDFRLKPGFTLVEVLVTIAISSILFLTISNLLTNVVATNTSIKDNITLNDEKETVYLMLKNYTDEAERLIYPALGNANGSFIVLNSPDSNLLPFTAFSQVSASQANANGSPVLKIYNFSLDSDGVTPVSTIPAKNKNITANGKNYSVDYTNNRVVVGTPGINPVYCQNQTSNDCILAGFQDNQLVYGTTAFAPFITITKPTDLCFEGTTLHILSPYELREYRINITDPTLPITAQTAGLSQSSFPYYFVPGSACQPGVVTFSSFPSFSGIEAVQSRYSVYDLQLKRDVYSGATSNKYELDQITYTLQKPQNTNQNTATKSPFFLFKLFKK